LDYFAESARFAAMRRLMMAPRSGALASSTILLGPRDLRTQHMLGHGVLLGADLRFPMAWFTKRDQPQNGR
jgi:hypothetical protein